LKKTFLLITLISLISVVNAQKQANYWYFGQNAGISFANGPPVGLTNGALNTGEGCSSISTAAGALEFYTDGKYVYNKNHIQMPNGSGLNGHSSSTQSGIIVPKPGSSTEYYIFTVDAADNNLQLGLCYSKVDMTLNNGLGDVVTTEKNISLVPLACEKVTAVGHGDGQTFWVITKKWGNADFYAYRITWDGVVLEPVISTTGPPLTGNMGQASKGYLKVSPDGTKIAAANNTDFSVGIYNFDKFTGIVTHLVSDDSYPNPGGGDPGGPYGVEFSPNSKRLFIGEWKANRRINQYDLSSEDPQTILSSKVVVASLGQSADPFGALQLGPDNRLYISRNNSNYLSRINQPNNLGAFVGYVENAVSLAGRNCRYGLPPFIQSFFFLTADFYWDEPACDGYPTQFNASISDTPDSLRWTFPGGVTTTEMDPTFHFSGPGLWPVFLKVFMYGQVKNVNRFVTVGSTPSFVLGNDTTICASEAFYLDAGEYSTFQWHNDSTTQSVLTDTTGWYWCRITNAAGCPATDSLYVTMNPNPEMSAGLDKVVPEGEATTLDGSVLGNTSNFSYHWEPALSLVNANVMIPTTVLMTTTTTFTLSVTNIQTGCTSEDEMLLTVEGGLLSCTVSASPLSVCRGEQSQLMVSAYGGLGTYTYSWSSNPPGFSSAMANPTVAPAQTTTYTVLVNDGETEVSKNITVTVIPLPVPNAGPDQVITHGTNTVLQGSVTQGTGPYSYQWAPAAKLVSTNVPNPTTYNLYESTLFTLHVTDLGTGCVCESDDFVTISIDGSALNTVPQAQPSTVCLGQPIQLYAVAGGGTSNYTYSWTSVPPGFTSTSAEPMITPTGNTVYNVTVNDGFNSASGSVQITVNPLPSINLLPIGNPLVQIINSTDIGICVFDSIVIDAGNPGASYLWSNGSTEQTISLQTSGISFDLQSYTVTVTDPITGCTNNSNIVAYFTFNNCSYGIDENALNDRLQLYPNPSRDGVFNYRIEGFNGATMLDVFTFQGEQIYSESINLTGGTHNSTLYLHNTRAGVYYLKVTNDEAVLLRKLIIQKQ